MQKVSKSFVVYLIGVFILGLLYKQLDKALGTAAFAGFVVVYLVALRWIGSRLDRAGEQ